MEILELVARLYLYLFAMGAGLFVLLAPRFARSPFLILALIPLSGMAMIGLSGVYVIWSNRPLARAGALEPLIWALAFLLLAIVFKRREVLMCSRSIVFALRRKAWLNWLIVLAVALVAMSPSLRAGFSTVPYRVGIDQTGVIQSANFLLKNGTIDQLVDPPVRDTLKIYYATQLELFLSALRWGAPFILAHITQRLHADSPYETALPLLVISYMIMLIFSARLARRAFGLKGQSAFLFSVLLGLNCNLLNSLFEGMWCQILAMPVIMLFVISAYEIRRGTSWVKATLFTAIVLAGFLSVYNEALLFVILLAGLIALADLCTRRLTKRFLFFSALALAGTFALTFPYSMQWMGYSIRNLSRAKSLGYLQPFWAGPAEIFGLMDIYSPQKGFRGNLDYTTLAVRSAANLKLIIPLNLLVTLGVVWTFFAKLKNQRLFWAIPFFVVIGFYLNGAVFREGYTNYTYMKSYTILLPMLWPVFVLTFVSSSGFSRFRGFEMILPVLVFCTLVFTGLSYSADYAKSGGVVTQDEFALRELVLPSGESSEVVRNCTLLHRPRGLFNYFNRETDRIHEEMLRPLLPLPTLSEWLTEYTEMEKYKDTRVCLLLKKVDLKCPSCYIQARSNRVLYENSGYLVVDTGKKLFQGQRSDSPGLNLGDFWPPREEFRNQRPHEIH